MGVELARVATGTRRPAPVVVGLDGSEASMAALRWAADEAAAHQAPLVAVHVLDPRSHGVASYARVGTGGPEGSNELEAAALVERLAADSSLTSVRRVFEVGVPSQVLVRCAVGARMLVLGHGDHHRRREGDAFHHGPVLGSIARACVAYATCPVVVIPIPERRPARDAARPEPREVQVAQSAPLTGRRTIYPNRQPVPIAHG
jgi:nucleotide-binding universal stress UspA family protein